MFASFAEYLKTRVKKPFNSRPRYFPVGDYLTCFVSERRCWSRRINEWLTLYEDIETGEVVGVKVKGLQAAGIIAEGNGCCPSKTAT